MSWQPSLLSQKRKTGPPLGLRNLGNSCYLNSVLQCLTYTPPLANFCLRSLHSSFCDSSTDAERKRDCPFCILEKRIARSLKADLAQDAPAKILSCLRLFAEHFRSGRQEDAHEFLRYVIDACHNTCLRLKKLRHKGSSDAPIGIGGNTIVKEIFGGSLQSQVKCLSCGAESNKVDEIMDISLDVLYSSSLKEALHKFFQPEVLDGNNKYKCENCKKLVVARKQMSVFQAPNVLVIQLKRFEGIYGGKIDKVISFDDVLVLSSFMCKASQDPSPEYNLFGTIVHAGCTPDSGHYYAYIKDAMGRWYCCNDAYISLATLEEGVKSQDCTSNLPSKPSYVKPLAEVSSWRNVSATAKVDKVLSGPRMKFNIAGNAGSKRVPALTNGKVDPRKNHLVEQNGELDTVQVNKSDKYRSIFSNGNGHGKENKVGFADSMKNQTVGSPGYVENGRISASDEEKGEPFASENGNGNVRNVGLDSVKSVLCESNGATSIKAKIRGADQHKLQNGSVPCQPDVSGSKRKLQDGCCILLAQDIQSRAKVEELKELLKNDASSVLRSCGWLEEVYSFMRLKKRSYASEVDNTLVPADYLK
ncbi:hypothetical protein CDL15_Pgr002309 [Punica granatum]|uniref:Ubiquitin carboxyl-terminal hydrolase n=1 Tax=Punica granatum TaxID=22663 RepID=A0A218XW92_PUNGR|nr:hypothetical protein CDL15_Pgr002309 [Punica granatum]